MTDKTPPAGFPAMCRVGIVEDDPYVRTVIERYLTANRFVAVPMRSGREVRDAVQAGNIDVLMLDLGLPGEDGLNILLALRTVSRIPVLIVSGRKETVSIAAGLDAGADDYVTKPIAFEELGARLRSVLRRADQGGEKSQAPVRSLTIHGAVLDLESRELTGPSGRAILTERETLILSLLSQSGGRPVSRAMLTRATVGQNWDFSIRTLDVHVSNIRSKLAAVGVAPSAILTVRNHGYQLSPSAMSATEPV